MFVSNKSFFSSKPPMQFVAIFNDIQYVIVAKSTHSFSFNSFVNFQGNHQRKRFKKPLLYWQLSSTQISNMKEYYGHGILGELKYLSLSNHVFIKEDD